MSEQAEQNVTTAENTGNTSNLELEIRAALDLPQPEYDTWKEEFIARKIAELTPQNQPLEISALSRPVSDFIGPRTEVKPKFIGSGFKIDDLRIYEVWLDDMRKLYEQEQWKNPDHYRALILNSVQHGIQRYFGNIKPSGEAIARRENRLWSSGVVKADEDPGEQAYSISEHKEEALCTERAAVAHNLLLFNGIDNYLYNGKLAIQNEGVEDLHSYIIYKNSQGKWMIYDPMNPELVFDTDSKLIGVYPALYEGGEEILAGGSADVKHKKLQFQNGKVEEIGHKNYAYQANSLLASMAE